MTEFKTECPACGALVAPQMRAAFLAALEIVEQLAKTMRLGQSKAPRWRAAIDALRDDLEYSESDNLRAKGEPQAADKLSDGARWRNSYGAAEPPRFEPYHFVKAEPPEPRPIVAGHSLERTSPKGEPFIGRCTRCGTGGLPVGASLDVCPASDGKTRDDVLLDALSDPKEGE